MHRSVSYIVSDHIYFNWLILLRDIQENKSGYFFDRSVFCILGTEATRLCLLCTEISQPFNLFNCTSCPWKKDHYNFSVAQTVGMIYAKNCENLSEVTAKILSVFFFWDTVYKLFSNTPSCAITITRPPPARTGPPLAPTGPPLAPTADSADYEITSLWLSS